MSRITDYGFLFQTTFGTSKTNLVNNIQLSQMNSSSVQKQLKAAGIDTNSKKYKAALSEMMKNGNGAMFTNVQAIKNLMSQSANHLIVCNTNCRIIIKCINRFVRKCTHCSYRVPAAA